MKIEITKTELQAALQEWEQRARDGKWMPTPDLSAAEVAAHSVQLLWSLLNAPPKSISRDDMSGEQLRAAHEA